MANFRRKPHEAPGEPADPESGRGDLATLLLQGNEMIEQTAAMHQRWGLGSAERWDVDQTAGTISWIFADGRLAVAPVQILGSFAFEPSGTWRWAWANESVLPPLREAAERVRAWGEERKRPALTEAVIACNETQAANLAAVAFRITHATGFYGDPAMLSTYFTFGDVTITEADGSVSQIRVKLKDG